jgi:hypothetical protein
MELVPGTKQEEREAVNPSIYIDNVWSFTLMTRNRVMFIYMHLRVPFAI